MRANEKKIAVAAVAILAVAYATGLREISLIPLIGVVWLSCVLGDTASFFVGRRLGRGLLLRHGAPAASPFVAGSSGWPYRRFIPLSVIGRGARGTILCVLGYVCYRCLHRVTAITGNATLAFGIAVGAIAGTLYAWRKLRSEQNRRALVEWTARQGPRSALRPLFALIGRRAIAPVPTLMAPRIGLPGDRLHPGRLGLGLTSALAVSAVGLYLFVVYATILSGNGAAPADRELLGVGDDLRAGGVVDAVKLITQLGSLATVATLVLGVSLVLLVRRHVTEAIALAAGSVLVYVAVRLAKEGIGRARPPGPLVSADGSSFPSGHAAYSTLWVAAAMAVAWCVPCLARGAVLIGASLAIAIAVGLSRIYLRVHYWSDVAGGWGLGAGILGVCAATALTVAFIRQNERGRASTGPSS